MEKENQEKPIEKKRPIRIGTISIILAAAAVLLLFGYGMMQSSPHDFFAKVVGYAFIGIMILWGLVLVYHFGIKSGSWVRGYVLAVTLLILSYSLMGLLVPKASLMGIDHFHFGIGTIVLIGVLSTVHKIDGKLDRRDFLFAIFAGAVMIGANVPFWKGMSFLDRLGGILEFLVQRIGTLI